MRNLRPLIAVSLVVSLSALAQGGGEERRAGQRRPPPEALAACEGKSAGTICQFSLEGRAMSGTCFTPASDKPMACRPEGGPPGPQQGH
jgi:hypothetical protein